MNRNALLKVGILIGTLLSVNSTYAEEYERGITVCTSDKETEIYSSGCKYKKDDKLVKWNDLPGYKMDWLEDKDWYVERVEVNHDNGIIVIVHFRYSDAKIQY